MRGIGWLTRISVTPSNAVGCIPSRTASAPSRAVIRRLISGSSGIEGGIAPARVINRNVA